MVLPLADIELPCGGVCKSEDGADCMPMCHVFGSPLFLAYGSEVASAEPFVSLAHVIRETVGRRKDVGGNEGIEVASVMRFEDARVKLHIDPRGDVHFNKPAADAPAAPDPESLFGQNSSQVIPGAEVAEAAAEKSSAKWKGKTLRWKRGRRIHAQRVARAKARRGKARI